ncbi:MAG: benzoate/H(+) symporter BenE family transporter, partial [Candidatus Methanomethylophilaceae archaeon]|nr:benzoate/H(+) symporter BenE family transporter [Candidatus Methanomethylophilaceae archaeon]
MGSFLDSVDSFFRVSERGSSFGTEIKGGLITFLSMSYILVVNPFILEGAAEGYTFLQLFTATALAAALSCLLMGLYARFPVSLAPGMGVNAFMAFTICYSMGFTFEQALAVVLVSGMAFFLISVTGLRKRIIEDIPNSMKLAITAGIGFFIVVIGL